MYKLPLFPLCLLFIAGFSTLPANAQSSKKKSKTTKKKQLSKILQNKILVHLNFDSDSKEKIIDNGSKENHGIPINVSPTKGIRNNALKFNGQNSRVMMPTFDKIKNSFTFACWVRTDKMHEIDSQSNSGYAGISGQNWLLLPPCGKGAKDAGAGISVGTNGISVYEHAGDYAPARLVYKKEIGKDWNHIAVVYFNKRPILYVNGKKVAKAGASPRKIVFPSNGLGRGYGTDPRSNFKGEVDEFMMFKKGLSSLEIKQVYEYSGGK